jgi:tetratricopeptide (TPR) repeat protein
MPCHFNQMQMIYCYAEQMSRLNHWQKICYVSAALLCPMGAYAIDTSGISGNIPDESRLKAIESSIQTDPNNLDNYYAYAATAANMQDYTKAAAMYEAMLKQSPNLPRIKLELAVTYMQLRRFDEAQVLIDEVLSGDIPPEVRKNLEPMRAELERATRRNTVGGSVSFGAYHNTNANAAPDSGTVNIRFAGQELPFELDEDGQKRGDSQAFTAVSLTHQYRHPNKIAKDVQGSWQSSATYYRNQYRELRELNVQVAAVRTGPVVTAMDGKLQAGVAAGYNYITLDRSVYQKQYVGEITVNYALDAVTRLRLIATKEWRNYVNSPKISSFDIRDGQAEQVRAGVTYALTEKDSVDGEVKIRREGTERRFYDNHQKEVTLNYTHQFPEGWFVGGDAGFRITDYDAPDPSISGKVRKERELSVGSVVGKTFDHNVTATVGYEYRDVNANITNYAYDDHRVSTSVGWRF